MIQEKKKHKKSNKKPSAMAQVHNRVNAGVMDGVCYGGMMEAAEPEDEYEIGFEDDANSYAHVVNESSDCVPFLDLILYSSNAYPFITLRREDGTDTDTFVGEAGEEHNTMPAALVSNGDIKKEDFPSLWDIKRNEYKSGRIWFTDNAVVASFYSYHRDNYQRMYREIVDTLLVVREKLGVDFNIGKVILDFWTFPKGHDDILFPVRWLNNGIADAYFPHMIQCLPVENGNFKLVTDDMGKFIFDWKGDEVKEEKASVSEGKKTMYITEEQLNKLSLLLEDKEGKNLARARHFLQNNGYSPEDSQKAIEALRTDIPNSRLQQSKFMLGVARMYLEKQLSNGHSIALLNKMLKYAASDTYVNEFDYNLNGENVETLADRFKDIAKADLEKSKAASNQRQLTANENYTIIPIDSPEEASKYGDYAPWCVTHDPGMYYSYTHDGLGRFYFCLRNGFQNEPREVGEGCPLDRYGLSMIAVSVTFDGELNTVTCRWNHKNGGNDKIMTLEELENVLGRNFYQTFKPYTKEELRNKGIILPEDVQGLLDSGVNPREILQILTPFDNREWKLVSLRIGIGNNDYDEDEDEDEDEDYAEYRYNFLNEKERKLLSDTWYDSGTEDFFNCGDGVRMAIVCKNEKFNYIDIRGIIQSDIWFDKVEFAFRTSKGEYVGRVVKNGKTNLICFNNPSKKGMFLFNNWYDEIGDFYGPWYFARVKINGKCNFINAEGKYLSDQWFDDVVNTNENLGVVVLNEKKNLINAKGELIFGNQWFDDIEVYYGDIFINGFAKVELNEKWNLINIEGKLISSQWFDSVGEFSDDGFAAVQLNGKHNFINTEGKYISNQWFDNVRGFTHGFAVVQLNGKYNVINTEGKLVSEEWFNKEYDAYNFSHNLISESTSKKGVVITEEQKSKKVTDYYDKYVKSFIDFLHEQHLRIDPLPDIEFNDEQQEGLFIRTGYYSPDEKKIVVFTCNRALKDIMRTVAHEFVHHMQNLENPEKDWGTAGDLEDDRKLRGIEGEAFLLGNILFREWTEKLKKTKELNESRKLLNEITDEIVEPDDVDLSSFNIKKHLNPKFWDDGHLDTRIRLKLLDIADDFFSSLDVDWVEPEDVIMTGSLANYNWNKKYSDIDLHVLVDYEDVDKRVDFVREYFTLKKNEWNEKHKGLRIFGFPVEVYVQDSKEPHASSGVYSIDRDEWITEPDINKIRSGKVDKKHVREMVSTYMNKIDCLIDIYKHHKDDKHEMEKVAKDAAEMMGEIKNMRKEDLAKYGREMCDGNIIFKALRRSDYIGKLIKLKNLTYDKINSI